MHGYLMSALRARGLGTLGERLLAGERAADADLAALAELPLPLLCGLADAVRARSRGQDVRLRTLAVGLQPGTVVVDATDLSGGALLRAVAVARLTAPEASAVAVRWDVGDALAELVLTAGADTLFGELSSREPGLGHGARLQGLAQRNGRPVRWLAEAPDGGRGQQREQRT